MSSYAILGTLVTSTASSATTPFVTSTPVAIGDLISIRYGNAASSRPAGLACVDSTVGSTNTFAIAADVGAGAGGYSCIFWCVATSAIPSGTTININTTGTFAFRAADGIKCTNPLSSTPVDSAVTSALSGTSTAAVSAAATASPTTSDWVGVVAIDYAASSVLQQTGWTEDNDNSTVGWESQTIIGTNTTAMRGAGTLSAAGAWACSCAVFKLGGVAAAAKRPAIWRPSAAVVRASRW